jgi:hypothetical protein
VRRSVLLLQAAQARREAVSAADKGEFEQASQVLRRAAENIELSAGAKNEELAEEQSALLQQAEELERGEEFYGNYSRKFMATQAMYTMTDRHESTQFLRAREVQRALSNVPKVNRKEDITPTVMTWRDQTVPLERDLIRIGRAPQNEIVLPAKNVSRFHCQIKREGDKLIIEDLGSTNGTFINEEPLKQPHILCVGDIVRVGHEQVVFHDGQG